MKERLYAERDPNELEPHRMRHLLAMTAEGLHSKADIASELAYRDMKIARLREALQDLRDAASQCDSWESFPWAHLGDADDVLKETK